MNRERRINCLSFSPRFSYCAINWLGVHEAQLVCACSTALSTMILPFSLFSLCDEKFTIFCLVFEADFISEATNKLKSSGSERKHEKFESFGASHARSSNVNNQRRYMDLSPLPASNNAKIFHFASFHSFVIDLICGVPFMRQKCRCLKPGRDSLVHSPDKSFHKSQTVSEIQLRGFNCFVFFLDTKWKCISRSQNILKRSTFT